MDQKRVGVEIGRRDQGVHVVIQRVVEHPLKVGGCCSSFVGDSISLAGIPLVVSEKEIDDKGVRCQIWNGQKDQVEVVGAVAFPSFPIQ